MDDLDRLGAVLGDRYTLERPLGLGGMATVYLATDLRHRRQVAIKVLRPEYTAAIGRARFLREIEIVAGLTHPHIVPLYDSGSIDEVCYFVMPFVEGETLRELLDRRTTLPIAEAVRIAAQVADALAHAHANGVVHRDIKPRNIMMEAGHAVVSDFGIALSLKDEESTRLTGTGLSIGTPHYMSPEQANGERSVDERTDVYSLGCVLFEMLAGDPPFAGSRGQAILARKAAEPPPDVRVIRELVSDSLDATLRKALSRDPEDRFGSAAEMRDALEEEARAGASGSVSVRTERVPAVVRSAVRYGRLARIAVLTLASVVGALLLALVVGYLTTRAYDIKLQVPERFAPSSPNYLASGRKALTGFSVYAAFFVLVVLLARFAGALLVRVAGSIPGVGPAVTETLRSVSRRARTRWRSLDDTTRGQAFFVACFGISAIVVYQFATLMYSLLFGQVELLSCGHRNTHRAFSVIMAFVVTGLALGWYVTFAHTFRTRTAAVTRVARMASAGLIVALVVIQSVPWSLMWQGSNPRVLIDGERGYVLVETPRELVVHNAERRTTEVRTNAPDNGVVRLGVAGYVFEEPAAFHSGMLDCTALTTHPATGVSP